MPSGAKRRKASKKKTKKGEAQDSNSNHSNSSSTHSHGIDDPKSLDERESDGGEYEREEEEEKGYVGGEEEAVDRREGDIAKGKELEEEVVRVEMETKPQENGSGSADLSAVNVEKETLSLPGNSGVEDKEVAVVEEEKSIIPELGELKGQDASSALVDVPRDEIPKAVDYISEEEVRVGGASVEKFRGSVEEQIPDVESVKEVIPVPQEVSAEPSDVVNSDLMKDSDSVSQISDDKEKFSSATKNLQSEKIETEAASIDQNKSLDAPTVNTSSTVDAAKALETGKQLEEQVVAPATTTTQVADSAKNGEIHMQAHDHVAATVANTSREVDNSKELETQKQLEEKPLVGSNPLPVRRTSLMGCCGLFEVFSGGNK